MMASSSSVSLVAPIPSGVTASSELGRCLRIDPFRSLSVPAPVLASLIPAVGPIVQRGGARLRLAVLMTVVVGAVSLLAYASWSRVSQGQAVSSASRL